MLEGLHSVKDISQLDKKNEFSVNNVEKTPISWSDIVNKYDFKGKNIVSENLNSSEINKTKDFAKNTPLEGHGGTWTGERGNSSFIPDNDVLPPKNNPEKLTWKELKEKYGFEEIPFKNGEPDFSEISKASVEIENFSTSRSDNFDKADAALAEKWDMTPEEVAKYRKENNLTWHERKDMKTMDLVPSDVHGNIPHSGGISEAKKQEKS